MLKMINKKWINVCSKVRYLRVYLSEQGAMYTGGITQSCEDYGIETPGG